jgi:hypothetical protein
MGASYERFTSRNAVATGSGLNEAVPNPTYPRMILSGGQTGVDRAALDVAIALGLEHGGWCPRGRKAEDGRIDERYQLRETESSEYHVRTEMNVQAADATLILAAGALVGGTKLTEIFALRHGARYRLVNMNEPIDFDALRAWLRNEKIAVLNVAGPRESTQPGAYQQAFAALHRLLSQQNS